MTPLTQQLEDKKKEILNCIFEHYWWNIRGFSYRCNNNEDEEREVLALALEPLLNNEIRKPQEKTKVNIINKLNNLWKK